MKIQVEYNNTYGDFMNILNLAKFYQYDRFIYADDAFYFIADTPFPGYIEPLELPLNDGLTIPGECPAKCDFLKWYMEAKWRLLRYEIKHNLTLTIGLWC